MNNKQNDIYLSNISTKFHIKEKIKCVQRNGTLRCKCKNCGKKFHGKYICLERTFAILNLMSSFLINFFSAQPKKGLAKIVSIFPPEAPEKTHTLLFTIFWLFYIYLLFVMPCQFLQHLNNTFCLDYEISNLQILTRICIM